MIERDALGQALCRAWGLDPSTVNCISITIEAGCIPRATIWSTPNPESLAVAADYVLRPGHWDGPFTSTADNPGLTL